MPPRMPWRIFENWYAHAAVAVRADAGLTIEAGGVAFPLVRTFWTGDAQRNLGAAVRSQLSCLPAARPTCD